MVGWLTNSMDMNLSKLQEMVKNGEAWCAVAHGDHRVAHELAGEQQQLLLNLVFPGGTSGKEPTCHAGDIREAGSVPGAGRSPRGGWKPTPVFLPGESRGQRSLVGAQSIGLQSWTELKRLSKSQYLNQWATTENRTSSTTIGISIKS